MASAITNSKSTIDDYIKIEKIGEGTYGVVYKGKHKKTNRLVALKKIRLDSEEEGVPSTAIREIGILKELIHPGIVTLEDVLMQEGKLYLVFEFLTMDLKKYLDTLPQDKIMDPFLVKSYMHQILEAMMFCHTRRVIHRDLKPQNLLIDSKGNIKLADFGLGRSLCIPIRAYTHEIVTLWYRSPEVLLGSPRYSLSVDIWSIGCIFSEMATKKPIFRGDSEIDQLFRIFRTLSTPTEETWPGISQLPDYKSNFPQWKTNNLANQAKNMQDDAIDLLKEMFIYDPVNRISCKKALSHRYFSNFVNPQKVNSNNNQKTADKENIANWANRFSN